MDTKIRTIITGSTGMVGEGVLHECLNHRDVEAVLVINRHTCGVVHPKLNEIIYKNFFDLSEIVNQLSGYNACYFCLGMSSVGAKAEEYYRLTYTLTMQVAQTLSRLNPEMTFCYVSGAGTRSSEHGGMEWSRVKGKTENDLMKLPFKQVFNFRPGFMKPTEGLKNTHPYYRYFSWLYPIGRALYPKGFCTLRELGLAMINATKKGYPKAILEGGDIIVVAKGI
jgi:uncharacterized protein YbjT (DUF2867 family)